MGTVRLLFRPDVRGDVGLKSVEQSRLRNRGDTGLEGQERDDLSCYRGSDMPQSLSVSNMFCTCRDIADAIDDGFPVQGCLLNCFGLQTPCLDLSAERPLMGVLAGSQQSQRSVQICLRHVIDTTTRCGSRSIVVLSGPASIQPLPLKRGSSILTYALPPRSWPVRDFPQLVASEFQDIPFLCIVLAIKIPFLSTHGFLLSLPSLPISPSHIPSALHNAFSWHAFPHQFHLP